jgi:cell division transport system permease protein
MPLLRALVYFLQEAFTSLRRSWLINAVSVGTIAVSLFVLGAFLTLASNLHDVVMRWTQKVQVVFYLEDGIEGRVRESLENRLAGDPAVDGLVFVSRSEALDRFRSLFRDLRTLPEDLGENPSYSQVMRPITVSAGGPAPGTLRARPGQSPVRP